MKLKAEKAAAKLETIRNKMLALLSEANKLIRDNADPMTYERARFYWLGNVKIALTDDHDYLGGAGVSCDDTIRELREEE